MRTPNPTDMVAAIATAIMMLISGSPPWSGRRRARSATFLRANLVVPRWRRRRTPVYGRPFADCEGPNDVWCIDFKGWFVTGDGTRADPLTVSDAASRYLPVCQAVGRADLEHVSPHLARAFADYGLPQALRSDNGPPFAGIDHRGRLTRHDRATPKPVDLMDNAAALPAQPHGLSNHHYRHERNRNSVTHVAG